MNYSDYKYIDGSMFEGFIRSGVSGLKRNIQTVNDLNVFPIPDGDTGDNMYLTLEGGIREMERERSHILWKKAGALARGMLLAARGNSGVILSQIFYGISTGLGEKEKVTLPELTQAFHSGVNRAYETVMSPVEGTILTVARESAQMMGFADEETTLGEYASHLLNVMRDSLENTPELLDVLKEAGVVDSGGAGLLMIVEGAAAAVRGESEAEDIQPAISGTPKLDLGLFTEDSVLEFGYCTEFLLRLMRSKVDVERFDENVIIEYLSTLGDSIVAFKDGSIVKVHVHTMTPSKALEFCQQFGEFLTVKIENMMLQHNNHVEQLEAKKKDMIPTVKKSRCRYATCVVASGEGIKAVFRELGADEILEGGQTKNPSTQDFLECFDRLNADAIFVFPNNSNIFLAAQQAAGMYTDSEVYVIPSRSLGQAYTAMSMLDISFDTAEEVRDSFITNMEYVATGMVCKASREYRGGELSVSEEEYVGLTDRQMLSSSPDKVTVLKELCVKMGIAEREIATVIFGEDASEEDKEGVRMLFRELWPDKEFYEIDGQQEVYDLIVILE